MQLSVKVKRQKGIDVFFCRGCLLQGGASDYLFHLLTRSNRRDVILDLAALTTFDQSGLQAVMLSSSFLAANHRRLFLRHAPPNLLEYMRRGHEACFNHLFPFQARKLADAANG
jgi:anti-anti-sigma regulatory factor